MEHGNRHHDGVAAEVKRGAGVTRFLVVLVLISGLGYGGATLTGALGSSTQAADPPTSATSASASTQPAAVPPAQEVLPAADPLAPRPALLERGDTGPQVRALQARLRQLAWYPGDVTDTYGPKTTAAVKGFQRKRGLPALGYVDQRTMKRLTAMTHAPTKAELENRLTPMGNVPGKLDPRCLTGRALCIDKSSRTLRFVVDGEVWRTVDVRFGASYTPTREGVFHVYWKDADHVSKMFGSAMPFAMFFSRGQAVHYSSDFAARGYSGASHGCVNVRDYDGVKWLFEHVQVGDKVVIYWS
jgi:peptidoglycan hydrolase-like protein with peptidoglycan-binding domain